TLCLATDRSSVGGGVTLTLCWVSAGTQVNSQQSTTRITQYSALTAETLTEGVVMAKAKTLTLYKSRGGRKPCPYCGKLHDPDLDMLAAGFKQAITLLMVAHDSGDV